MTKKLTAYESRQTRGRGWEDHGPVLRHRTPRAAVGSRFVGPLEAVVWIATRDLDAIEGALGYVSGGEDRSLPPNSGAFTLIVLDGTLPRDVAGHHLDCASSDGRSSCTCENLGRKRYCRCEDHLLTYPHSCSCVRKAKAALIDAIHDGMPVYGRPKQGQKPINVGKDDPTALIDMQYYGDDAGLRLIPSYVEELFSWSDLLSRWPENCADELDAGNTATRNVVSSSSVNNDSITLEEEALVIFMKRACDGFTKWPAAEEARRIASQAEKAKNTGNIAKWMRPYYSRLFTNKRFDKAAVPQIKLEVEADILAKKQGRLKPD